MDSNQNFGASIYNFLVNLPVKIKRCVFPITDIFVVILTYLISKFAFFGTLGEVLYLNSLIILVVCSFSISSLMGVNRLKLFGFDLDSIKLLAGTSSLLLATSACFSILSIINETIPELLTFSVFYFLIASGLRLAVLGFLDRLQRKFDAKIPVAVYGAGSAGVQLVAALKKSNDYYPAALVDDKPSLKGLNVSGLIIKPKSELSKMVNSGQISRIILAMPSLSFDAQNKILEGLPNFECEIQTLPSLSELISGKSPSPDWETIPINKILSRNDVELEMNEANEHYKSKVIMVTGAGGSIGSELCIQLVKIKPAAIVLIDNSEYALYKIEQKLSEKFPKSHTEIYSTLGSVTDEAFLKSVIEGYSVHTIFHTAAFKHVPLVEKNPLEGVKNNVLGTLKLCQACKNSLVEELILISSDKAVRPTNIMGATKRLAELVIQEFADRGYARFTSVRFGNVFGSSGSVIPLFKSQIEKGGPVTITDQRVTRYFMSISEAVRLVLIAGTYAKGGDVFVLDMGKPKKIFDIAKQMILLSGQKIKTAKGVGDGIEIEEIGLREGEKLYEELLIDNNTFPTPNKKILRAKESKLQKEEFNKMTIELEFLCGSESDTSVKKFLKNWVREFDPKN